MNSLPQSYHLAIVWNWEHDRDFVYTLESIAHSHGLSTFLVAEHNVEEALEALRRRRIRFLTVLDRASDEDERFHPLAHFLSRRQHGSQIDPPVRIINPYDLQRKAADKATMHLELLAHGVEVPYTIIISPYAHKREVELSLTELARLGRPFIIKPANTTGGGIGVVTGAESLRDIIDARQHHKNDKYLLQEEIRPAMLGNRRAWFRVFYAAGDLFPCWWDDQTHAYEQVTGDHESAFGLSPLRHITSTIHGACRLDFFSTEIVFTRDRKFVAVDYVNEICDMRVQSVTPDGVPDAVIRSIASALVRLVESHTKGQERENISLKS